jgi:hypothetical protein
VHQYCTVQEWLNHPTGLNVANLIPIGNQQGELQQLIAFASAACDRICYQRLYAHQATDQQRVRPDAYGSLAYVIRYFPIVNLVSAQFKQYPTDPWMSVDMTQVMTDCRSPEGLGATTIMVGDRDYSYFARPGTPGALMYTTYIAGFPNCMLTSDVTVGSTTFTVDDATGVTAGTLLRVYDIGSSVYSGLEDVVVSSVSGNVITLEPPGFAFQHVASATAPIRISSVPEVITLACIEIVSDVIKQRRAGGGIVMKGELQPSGVNADEYRYAKELLKQYARVI